MGLAFLQDVATMAVGHLVFLYSSFRSVSVVNAATESCARLANASLVLMSTCWWNVSIFPTHVLYSCQWCGGHWSFSWPFSCSAVLFHLFLFARLLWITSVAKTLQRRSPRNNRFVVCFWTFMTSMKPTGLDDEARGKDWGTIPDGRISNNNTASCSGHCSPVFTPCLKRCGRVHVSMSFQEAPQTNMKPWNAATQIKVRQYIEMCLSPESPSLLMIDAVCFFCCLSWSVWIIWNSRVARSKFWRKMPWHVSNV